MFEQLAVPARAVGGFVEMSLETFRATFRRPFQFGEFVEQTW
ncbi:MAG: ABC transporter permease, partial [Mycobacterium sp.]